MPIYEYKCESCGYEAEYLQKISEPPVTECPKCHQSTMKKLISPSAFRLKGTGWYETDFKSKKSEPVSSDSNSTKNQKSAASGESKPAKNDKTADKK